MVKEKEETLHSHRDYPWFRQGVPPDFYNFQKVSYIDELEQCWGKPWGSQGIGKLKEVAVIKPTTYESLPIYEDDQAFFYVDKGLPNLEKMQAEHDAYVGILEANGVKIHYMEYPDPPLGPYGVLKRTTSAGVGFVIRGGAIIPREAAPYTRGRCKYITKFLANLGCPILFTVHGTGICEVGASVFFAENALLTFLSSECNKEALDQLLPIFKRAGITDIVIANSPGPLQKYTWHVYHSMHPDMWFAPLDKGLILIYPRFCDYETIRWFLDRKFTLIEIDEDEQRNYVPANLMLLQPGKVIMHRGAEKAIAKVRAAGVEVIEVNWSEALKYGGGIRCATMQLIREPGPGLPV